jgi:alpha-L-fucosidase
MYQMIPAPATFRGLWLYFLAMLSVSPALAQVSAPPPEPLLPIPTARQLAYQQEELRMFLHFGVNTFTDREWGEGTENPDIFTPESFDARQWARIARETGFSILILTAKHHDGFALWNSAFTEHDVGSSPWRGGRGDVVREVAAAAREEGLKLGLYLSPWDRHEPSYGDEEAYNAYYLGQLRELLTRYGTVHEVWFDGAKGEDAKDMNYHFDAFWAVVRQLQPEAVMFSDAGPDIRWIGNERGYAGATNWSVFDRSKVGIGQVGIGDYLNQGEAEGPDWVPGECNTSIRPGWFYHPDEQPKTVDELMEIYYQSVGRNCVLLLNVPPDPRGLFADADAERLREFKQAREAAFTDELAAGATATASNVRANDPRYDPAHLFDDDQQTYWATDDAVRTATLDIDLGSARTFNVVRLQEPIQLGQRIRAYRVEAEVGGTWQVLSEGTTIGYRKLDRFDTVTAGRIRVTVLDTRAAPIVSGFGVYHDPRW